MVGVPGAFSTAGPVQPEPSNDTATTTRRASPTRRSAVTFRRPADSVMASLPLQDRQNRVVLIDKSLPPCCSFSASGRFSIGHKRNRGWHQLPRFRSRTITDTRVPGRRRCHLEFRYYVAKRHCHARKRNLAPTVPVRMHESRTGSIRLSATDRPLPLEAFETKRERFNTPRRRTEKPSLCSRSRWNRPKRFRTLSGATWEALRSSPEPPSPGSSRAAVCLLDVHAGGETCA